MTTDNTTIVGLFEVVDETSEYFWLSYLNESTLSAPVPKEKRLSENAIVKAQLVAENKQNIAWRIKQIQTVHSSQ